MRRLSRKVVVSIDVRELEVLIPGTWDWDESRTYLTWEIDLSVSRHSD
jgi:hypothetical protein